MNWMLATVNVATAIWVGAIVCQSMIVAPVVFRALDKQGASRLLRGVFPRLFKLGIGCGVVVVAGVTILGASLGWQSWRIVALLLSLAMLIAGIASLLQIPAINAARDAGAAGARRFTWLHRSNVALTVLVLMLGLALLVIFTGQGFV